MGAWGIPDFSPPRRPPPRQEVAGPYRDQSSVPAIRRGATQREHRKVNPLDVFDPDVGHRASPLAVPPLASLAPPPGIPGLARTGAPGMVPMVNLLNVDVPETPQSALRKAAQFGWEPDAKYQQQWSSGVFAQIAKVAREKLASQEGIHADPVAEALISTAATAGLGGIAGLLRGGVGAAAGAAAGSEASTAAKLAPAALETVAEDAAPTILSRLARAAGAPGRARTAAEDFAALQGEKLAGRAGATVGRQAVHHPALTTGALLASADQAGIPIPGAQEANALIGGTLGAITDNPVGTTVTTGRALAGSVAALAGLGYSAADSVVHADPAPFLNTAGTQLEGLEEIGGKLLSGDEDLVQKTTEDESGLSFMVPVPALRRFPGLDVPGVGRIPSYIEGRSRVRDIAKSGRRVAAEHGVPRMRHGPGEQNVFALAERRGQRRDTAEMGQRETAPDILRGAKEGMALEKAARDLPGARSLRNVHGIQGGDIIQTIADYGLNHPDQLALLDRYGPTRGGTVAAGAAKGDVNLAAVVAHIKEHPEILTNPKVREAVETYRAGERKTPLAEAGEGLRASRLSQAALLGVRDAVERIPAAAERYLPEKKGGGWSREEAWDFAKDQEVSLTKLRASARQAEAEAQVLVAKLTERERSDRRRGGGDSAVLNAGREKLAALRADASGKRAAAKHLERELKGLKGELKPFTRPEHAVSSRARRQLWDDEMVAAMVKETDEAAAAHGLDPGTWTHHGELASSAEKASSPRGGNVRATGVQHVRRSPEDPVSLAARDSVARDLGSLIEGSIEGPRRKAGLQKFGRKFFSKNHIQLEVMRGGKLVKKGRLTFPEFNKAVRDGKVSEHYTWVPESEYKQPFASAKSLEPEAQGIAGEIAETGGKGTYGLVVKKEAYKEYVAQTNPEGWLGEQFINAVSKGAGRTLLFSPAWVQAQAVAEILPMIMARPKIVLDPSYVGRLQYRLKKAADIDPEAAIGWAATMGESPVRAASPRDLKPGTTRTHSHFHDAARAIEHTKVGRIAFSTVRMRPFVVFDQWRQGKYRQILAAAEVDRQLNGFMGGLQGALRNQKKMSDELKGLSKEKQLHEIQANPRYREMLDETGKYVEAIAGNWTAFTRFERAFAPAAVFYGFIRYAFRWPLTFATHHPVSATVNYFLAQQNANQVEKLLGDKPASFYQYGNPVVQGADGESSWLPGGSRISPGLSGPAQGILAGSGAQAAVGSLNPVYQSINALINGTTGFGTHDEDTGLLGLHWSLAAKTLVSMPPLVRLLGVGQSESDTAKQLRELDPNRSVRSFGAPFLPQSGDEARESNEIIQALSEDGGSSSSGSSSGNPLDVLDDQLGGGSNPLDQLDKALGQ